MHQLGKYGQNYLDKNSNFPITQNLFQKQAIKKTKIICKKKER